MLNIRHRFVARGNDEERIQTKYLGIAGIVAIVAAVALAAIAFGPMNLRNLTAPGKTNDTGPGTGATATPIQKPVWHVGDSWTYDLITSSRLIAAEPPAVTGNITETVVSADQSTYNVSVRGSFQIDSWMDLPAESHSGSGMLVVPARLAFGNATLDGYTIYRASDLAMTMDVREVHVPASIWTQAGPFNAMYTAKVATTYEPALDIWAFPLGENETWNVTSNATVRASIQWSLDGPNESWGYWHNFTVTVPIHLSIESGASQNVTTPTGTFAAIPVRASVPPGDSESPYVRIEPGMGLGAIGLMERHVPIAAAFSGAVGNIVKSSTLVGGIRLEVVLASFRRS